MSSEQLSITRPPTLHPVTEKLDLPLVKTTPLTGTYSKLANGAHWLICASFGVSVDSTIIVESLEGEDKSVPARARISEQITLRAPLPLFYMSKGAMVRRHTTLFQHMDEFVQKAGIRSD